MLRGLILLAALLLSFCVRAADVPGTITVLEGDALVYRGAGRLQALEGLRLALGDIIETADKSFMQVELPDKSVLQLGPETRAMLGGGAPRAKPERWLFVMNGWCKMSGPKEAVEGTPGLDIRTRWFDVPSNPGVVVFQATPTEVTAFAERGDVRLAERQASGAPVGVSLRAGDYYRRKWPDRGAINGGSPSAFVAAMPRSFRDSLPSRIDKYRDEDVRAKDAPDFVYADVEPWLKAETWIRRPLVQRWRGKAREPAFRSALVANLSSHPEWDPILFPEKYIKKEVVVKRPAPATPSSSAAEAMVKRLAPAPAPAPATAASVTSTQ
jgi:hypothetical protein